MICHLCFLCEKNPPSFLIYLENHYGYGYGFAEMFELDAHFHGVAHAHDPFL
jgi:hypothetical protein